MTGERGAVGSYIKEAIRLRHPDAHIHHVDAGVDLRDRGQVQAWLAGKLYNVLVLAAATRLTGANRGSPSLMADDIAITTNVLPAVKPGGHVTYLSSAMVYEGPGIFGRHREEERFSTEEGAPIQPWHAPSSPIGIAKVVCERAVRMRTAQTGGTHTIWRLHNVITPRELHDDPAHVQAYLFREIVHQVPEITMRSSGLEMRCWTWVGDVSMAIADNLTTNTAHAAMNRTFNLGSGMPATVRQLADAMVRTAKTLGYVSRDYAPVFDWAPTNLIEMPDGFPSIDLAQQELGYQPRTMLTECISLFLSGKSGGAKHQVLL